MRFALQELRKELAERFPQASYELPPAGILPTGLPRLDACLPGGGLPRGCLVELEGLPSSGKASVVDQMAAALTVGGGRVGYIDLPGTFYPPAAAGAGACLERLLVVRPVALPQALWACELLVRSRGFELVVCDLTVRPPPRLAAASLHRLARVTEQGACVVLFLTEDLASGGEAPERPVKLAQEPKVLPASVTAMRLVAERSMGAPSVRVARSRWRSSPLHALRPRS